MVPRALHSHPDSIVFVQVTGWDDLPSRHFRYGKRQWLQPGGLFLILDATSGRLATLAQHRGDQEHPLMTKHVGGANYEISFGNLVRILTGSRLTDQRPPGVLDVLDASFDISDRKADVDGSGARLPLLAYHRSAGSVETTTRLFLSSSAHAESICAAFTDPIILAALSPFEVERARATIPTV